VRATAWAFYAMPASEPAARQTDEDYILALLRKTGVLCVYGSGFGRKPADGFFRVVYLAEPRELNVIYDLSRRSPANTSPPEGASVAPGRDGSPACRSDRRSVRDRGRGGTGSRDVTPAMPEARSANARCRERVLPPGWGAIALRVRAAPLFGTPSSRS